MAEWLYEAGIGEERAALVDGNAIVEALIERDDLKLRAGAVMPARLTQILVPGRRGVATMDGGEALIEPLPSGVSGGARLLIVITREAIGERGRPKRARARAAEPGDPPHPAPTLRERLAVSGHPVTSPGLHGADRLEAAGWSELIEEAQTGEIAFDGGALRLSLTPAMTLFDVDGASPAAELACRGAAACAAAIRRLGIAGAIGIDLPTLGSKAERAAAAAAFDAVLPPPFERTAVNGFGFLMLVRRRTRASLPELLADDPIGAAARALMRRAERTAGAGTRTIAAAPAVIAAIAARPDWIDRLAQSCGAPIALRADGALPTFGGHVQPQHITA